MQQAEQERGPHAQAASDSIGPVTLPRGGAAVWPMRLPWKRQGCSEDVAAPCSRMTSPAVNRLIGDGAQERTRTFTAVKPLAPEASASTNSTTWAQGGLLRTVLAIVKLPDCSAKYAIQDAYDGVSRTR